MTAADLPYVVAAAPWTAMLSALLVGLFGGALGVGFAWWAHSHDERCASCAGGFLDDPEFRKIVDAAGVTGGE